VTSLRYFQKQHCVFEYAHFYGWLKLKFLYQSFVTGRYVCSFSKTRLAISKSQILIAEIN
jgi:hypothetical protein